MNIKINKIISKILLITILSGSFTLSLSAKRKKLQTEQKKTANIDMITDAIDEIQKQIATEKHSYMISRTYEKKGDQIVSAVTKVHYTEYRKKPSYHKEVFNSLNSNLNSDSDLEVIEFVYKNSDKNHITKINKKNRKDIAKIDFHQIV